MFLFLERVDKHAQTHPSIFKDGQLAEPTYVSPCSAFGIKINVLGGHITYSGLSSQYLFL